MLLSRLLPLSVPGALALAAGWLLAGGEAAAQNYRRIPPDAKGYQVAQITQQNLQASARRSAETSRPRVYTVAPEVAESESPRVVTFTAPDGSTRTFVLEGSIRTAEPRQAVVRLVSK